jgi:hypothetical protein
MDVELDGASADVGMFTRVLGRGPIPLANE